MQVDEARAGQARREIVAARADPFEKAAPALARLCAELFGGICLVVVLSCPPLVHGVIS